MNRLKYVLGIQVPRRLPPNAAFSKSHFKGAYKRYQSEVYASKTSRLLTSRLRKINEFKGFHCARQTRNGIEPTQQQEFIQRHRNSTLLKRAYIGRRYSVRNGEKSGDSSRDSKSVRSHASDDGLIEKEPRTYAQMIQFYSEAKYGGASSGTVIGIHKSPFSTASMVSQKWRSMSQNSRHGNICSAGLNAFSQDAKFSSEAATIGYRSRHYDKNLIGTSGEHALAKPTLSYARMIEKYSNSIIHNVDVCNRHVSLVPKRNVSTRLNKVHAVLMGSKDVDAKSFLPEVPTDATNVSENKRENAAAKNEGEWVTKVDDIMKDLKQVSGQPESTEKKVTEKSVNEPAHWLDRVVSAHKKKMTEKRTASKIAPDNMKSVENARPEKFPKNDPRSREVDVSMIKDQGFTTDIKQPPDVVATNNPTNPIVEYIKRGPAKPNPTSQSSTHSPTAAATSSGKHPQIELRMTPSQNESVVSINMDELAARSAGAVAKDQLSVVISSKKNRSGAVDASHANPNIDFGSMHVSISENTVPVKQIEFSINGKPVSELKSILARADKLDVVSSMDKVEIRIPSKTGGVAANEQGRNVASTAQSSTPVLNLQIAAKFNEPRFQQPRGPEVKPEIPHVTPRTPPTPPTPRSPPAAPSIPPKPSRPQNVFSPNTLNSPPTQVPPPAKSEPAKSETTKVVEDVDISNVTNAKGSENVNRTEDVASLPADKSQAPIRKGENSVRYVTRTSFPTVKPDEAVLQRSSMVASPTNSPHRRPSLNKQNAKPKAATESRIPSNIIPWWSSENSFNNIKKYANSAKTASPFDDFLPQKPEEPVKLTPENEQKSNLASKQKTIPVDIKRLDTPGTAKKNETSIVDETLNTVKDPKSTISVVRVKSPQQRWVPVKAKSGIRLSKYAKPASAASNKSAKRGKHRGRNSAFAGSNSIKRDSETLTIPSVHSTKIVKYVSVTPQRANVDKKSDAKSSGLRMEQKPNDSSKKDGDSKKGGSKTNKTPDAVQGGESRVGKVNVRQSNTAAKEEKNAGKKANAPADVPAKPATPKLGFGANKEQKRPETAGSDPKNLPNSPVKEDPRIKEIMKSMKPIEKKKDGTLIDYGVIVPSRKPAGQIRQIPRVQNKDVATQHEKLEELKNVPGKTKIVDQEKVSAAKNEAASKRETKKSNEPVKIATEKTEQKVVITVKENNVEIRKVSEPTSKVPTEKSTVEKKPKSPLISVRMDKNVEIQRATEPASRTLPVESVPEKKEEKPVNAASKNESTNRSATVTTGEAPLQGTVPTPPTKTTTDVVNTPATKAASFTVEKKEPSKDANSAQLERRVIAPSKKKSDPGPLTLQKPNAKAKEGDSPAGKSAGTTGVAPLQGTINPSSAEKHPGAGKSVGVKGDKMSEPSASPSNVAKTSAIKDSDKGAPKNDGGPITLQMSDTRTPVSCSKQRSGENNEKMKAENGPRSTYENETEDENEFFVSEPERPEKNLLYSSWLQRFKDRFDGNKLI